MSAANTGDAAMPSVQQERIRLLDALRGFALLGILILNIPFFGLPDPSFDVLTLRSEVGTINEKLWFWVNMTLNGTQRALFSLLFGAGIILFISRLEKRMEGSMPVEYFVRRQLWLIVFGLANVYILLWPGDILFLYGVLGIIAFVFRRLPVKALLIASVISMLLMTVRENVDLFRKQQKIHKGEAVALIDTARTPLTAVQQEDLETMLSMKNKWDSAALSKEMVRNTERVKGGFVKAYDFLAPVGAAVEYEMVYYNLWDSLIFIFLGMAFFKSGLLTGQGKTQHYLLLALIGWGLGLLLTYQYLRPIMEMRYNEFEVMRVRKFIFFELSRTLRSLGCFGTLMLLYKARIFHGLFRLLKPVGQMAFTNYLSQSVICNIYFMGFGMMGRLQRYEIYYVVVAVWIFQIIFSHLWLRHFRYGPLEWCWRSLTYWKRLPLRKALPV